MKTPLNSQILRSTSKLLSSATIAVALTALLANGLAINSQAIGAENQLRSRQSSPSVEQSRVMWQSKQAADPMPKRRSLVAQAAQGNVIDEMPSQPLVDSQVRQTGFYNGGCSSCGPVCDCGEVSCGVEPGYGYEVGCGAEYGEPGCGVEACSSCHGEPVCGMEAMGYQDASCGMESIGGAYCDSCGGGGCDSCCGVQTYPLFLPLLRVNWCRFDFFAGVQGFNGPMNFANVDGGNGPARAGSGSFGFYEGFNEGRSLKPLFGWDMSAQLGVRATQSNLSGAGFSDEQRDQVFITAGLFRRVDYGLQYGLVFDYLRDDWFYQADLTQLRGELSWKEHGCHVYGFQFMTSQSDDTSTTSVRDATGATFSSSISMESTDQYRLFYRRLLHNSGSWEAFAGWTDRDDGLLGASMTLPLRQKLALSAGATYLIPNEGTNSIGYQEESWNIGLGLVYRPGGSLGAGRYSRPMFDVADNGTFMVDRK
ncbi:hypothetical protein Pla52o_30720 [Novipirellula galeiformis]|uniref:Uncharacterized protein n=1 Tax=Novipirellula galeiformis TaxID=2528004 RepID=A0A5C6CET1_9BACT|nr:DUF6666 family protein [Novipirellula galeiformis]TWU22024.1 hypothetical protein Pla52o_30720 [Novipirellula galeiformis]